MKKTDVIIVVVILLLSSTFYFASKLAQDKYDYNVAKITVNGELYKTIELIDEDYKEEITIEQNGHRNVICIDGLKVRMEDADCADKVCIKMGSISMPGEMIVCLPNKIVIEIQGDFDGELDGSAY